ncbi:DNAJ PROTEIN HOMOLOG-LIKE [Salix koriyanagi]|uniref:DNAJ PROTEIN HOMOLOG-LIKE n=1 Tax=Salix koriyanagi TaxID=2511006 RepID=A0A9Q0ZLZ6_9ROSI|nr:DNAJ PROTEIN HOMOLOG-LIKE [Salix koriyanagi]
MLCNSYHFISPNHTTTKTPYSSPFSGKPCPLKLRASQARKTQPSVDSMATASSFYEVLGLPVSASGHEIKAAYRRLARTCHPDVVSMNQKEMSATEFIKIHAAYSTLSDPDKRANYDRDLFRNSRPFGSSSMRSATMAAASGYTCRNWETDQCW